MGMKGTVGAKGELKIKVIRAPGPGLRWHLSNRLRWGYIKGWLSRQLAFLFTKITNLPVICSKLEVRHIKADG